MKPTTFEHFDLIIKARQDEYFGKNPIPADGVTMAGIDWLTEKERVAMHELKMSLPTYGQLREEAKARIAERIKNRKSSAT